MKQGDPLPLVVCNSRRVRRDAPFSSREQLGASRRTLQNGLNKTRELFHGYS